jgi:hypothetical protein
MVVALYPPLRPEAPPIDQPRGPHPQVVMPKRRIARDYRARADYQNHARYSSSGSRRQIANAHAVVGKTIVQGSGVVPKLPARSHFRYLPRRMIVL